MFIGAVNEGTAVSVSGTMTTVMRYLVHNYDEILQAKKDPEVESWPLMGNPSGVMLIVGFYLYFVLKLGPHLMSKRPAYHLQGLLIAFNFFMTLLSAWLAAKPFLDGVFGDMVFGSCRPRHHYPLRRYVCAYIWWYFITKTIELLDTVFFVLRKKQNQITFLHVYHHASTLLFAWATLKYLTGEQGAFVTCLNSTVHIFMYVYYMIAAMGPKYQKYIWWKKYITKLQLVQFGMLETYLIGTFIYDCDIPKALSIIYFLNGGLFIILFSQFYQRTYQKRLNKRGSEKQQ